MIERWQRKRLIVGLALGLAAALTAFGLAGVQLPRGGRFAVRGWSALRIAKRLYSTARGRAAHPGGPGRQGIS